MKLYLKGARCFSSKCPIEKKGAVPPGMHGMKRSSKPTDYSLQLRAKQKAKRLYGVLETQFKNYYQKAKKLKGLVGDNLLILLERRLDNIIYLAGLSLSRSHAKQLISHRNVKVNGQPLTISSYSAKPGDIIELDNKIVEKVKDSLRLNDKDFKVPAWLDLNKTNCSVKIISPPQVADIQTGVDVNLIIEYYSR
jgi:small subunit ribosomal protein S4